MEATPDKLETRSERRTNWPLEDMPEVADAPEVAGEASGEPSRVSRRGSWHDTLEATPPWSGVGLVLLFICIYLTATESTFLTSTNLAVVARGAAVPLLLACGTTVLLTAGLIDLSMGSLMALTTMVLAGLFTLEVPPLLAVVLSMVFAAVLSSAVNGVLIAKFNFNFFVVTLGTLAIFRSVAQIPTSGVTVPLGTKPGASLISNLANGSVGPVPIAIIIALGATLAAGLTLRSTTFGRAIQTVGGNEEAARIAGIGVPAVKIAMFAVHGLLVGIAAVVIAGRTVSGSPDAGTGIELTVVAAVLLGGTSFVGGRSSLIGTVVGVAFISVLQNGLNLVSVNAYWQGVVTGTVLILAVGLDQLRARQ